MIRIEFDPMAFTVLDEMVNKKVLGIRQLESKPTLTEMAKVTFTLGTKSMMRNLSIVAKGDPQRYHHIYEWNAVGRNTQLLFFAQRERVFNGELIIQLVPLKSNKEVPIKKVLLSPGRSGKVVKRRSIFRNKAEVMESGRPVSFTTRRTIVFADKENKMVFVRPNRNIRILNPGGTRAAGALEEFAITWFNANIHAVLRRSGIYKKLQTAVATSLNNGMGPGQIQQVINSVTQSYSQNKTRVYGVDR